MRIYVDAAPVIYYVEQSPVFAAKVIARVHAPGVLIISSNLTRMESLIFPLRTGNVSLAHDYDEFFRLQVTEICCTRSRLTLTRSVSEGESSQMPSLTRRVSVSFLAA